MIYACLLVFIVGLCYPYGLHVSGLLRYEMPMTIAREMFWRSSVRGKSFFFMQSRRP